MEITWTVKPVVWIGGRSYVRYTHAGALRVVCLHCGRMVLLADALVDPAGPAFKAYYHVACAEAR